MLRVLPLAASAASLQGKHLWVSHGLQDTVIPLASARQIRDHASTLPLALTYQEFPGAHEIRPAELAAALRWLGNLAG